MKPKTTASLFTTPPHPIPTQPHLISETSSRQRRVMAVMAGVYVCREMHAQSESGGGGLRGERGKKRREKKRGEGKEK